MLTTKSWFTSTSSLVPSSTLGSMTSGDAQEHAQMPAAPVVLWLVTQLLCQRLTAQRLSTQHILTSVRQEPGTQTVPVFTQPACWYINCYAPSYSLFMAVFIYPCSYAACCSRRRLLLLRRCRCQILETSPAAAPLTPWRIHHKFGFLVKVAHEMLCPVSSQWDKAALAVGLFQLVQRPEVLAVDAQVHRLLGVVLVFLA